MSDSVVRGRNATQLARRNPFPFDDRIEFFEDTHTYLVDGKKCHLSVTGLLKKCFTPSDFQPDVIVRKNLASWRRKSDSKYHQVAVNNTDEGAATAIKHMWSETARLGTRLHLVGEHLLNGVLDRDSIGEFGIPDEVRVDGLQLCAFFDDHPELEPVRTELSMFYEHENNVYVCGQADAVVKDEHGRHCIIDFKRTPKSLTPDEPDWGRPGIGVLEGNPGNALMVYSVQTAIYAELFTRCTGITVDGCFLLQVHPDLDSYLLHRCHDLRSQARELLQSLTE